MRWRREDHGRTPAQRERSFKTAEQRRQPTGLGTLGDKLNDLYMQTEAFWRSVWGVEWHSTANL